MNELDIFVDFSSRQAIGLSAMEAMVCGAAVIVPLNGGATTFAINEKNSLLVNTSSSDECYNSLIRLLEDHDKCRRPYLGDFSIKILGVHLTAIEAGDPYYNINLSYKARILTHVQP